MHRALLSERRSNSCSITMKPTLYFYGVFLLLFGLSLLVRSIKTIQNHGHQIEQYMLSFFLIVWTLGLCVYARHFNELNTRLSDLFWLFIAVSVVLCYMAASTSKLLSVNILSKCLSVTPGIGILFVAYSLIFRLKRNRVESMENDTSLKTNK